MIVTKREIREGKKYVYLYLKFGLLNLLPFSVLYNNFSILKKRERTKYREALQTYRQRKDRRTDIIAFIKRLQY